MSYVDRKTRINLTGIGTIDYEQRHCAVCRKMRTLSSVWVPQFICTGCKPVPPQSVIDIEQDRRDEAAEMSWLYLVGRWQG